MYQNWNWLVQFNMRCPLTRDTFNYLPCQTYQFTNVSIIRGAYETCQFIGLASLTLQLQFHSIRKEDWQTLWVDSEPTSPNGQIVEYLQILPTIKMQRGEHGRSIINNIWYNKFDFKLEISYTKLRFTLYKICIKILFTFNITLSPFTLQPK